MRFDLILFSLPRDYDDTDEDRLRSRETVRVQRILSARQNGDFAKRRDFREDISRVTECRIEK